ncbi:MAG: hypothetical protein WAM39_08260 [Bryobacteraceae bacterium]
MAQWLYRIERIDFQPEIDPDVELEKVLQQYGREGWELAQVLYGHQVQKGPIRLILKAEKPMD